LAWGLGCACGAFGQAPDLEHMDFVLKSVPDGPIAKVNGVSVPANEFSALYQTELAKLAVRSGKRVVPDRVRLETALRSVTLLIQREILAQEAAKRKLTVTDEQLEQAWHDEIERVGKALQRESDKPPTEEEVLAVAGLSREEAMMEVRKEMLILKVREAIVEETGVTVTDPEVDAFFDENKALFVQPDHCHVKQITTRFGLDASTGAKQEARARIDKAMQRLRAGESFEAVATSVSEGPGKEQGGDMGTVPVAALPSFCAEAVLALAPGRFTDVIEGEVGYHIIKLVELASGGESDIEDLRPRLHRMLVARKAKQIVNEFCDPVLEDARAVQVFLELERALATLPGADELRGELSRSMTGVAEQP